MRLASGLWMAQSAVPEEFVQPMLIETKGA